MHSVNRVQVRQSPYLDVFHTHYNTRLTIDSGATGNMLRASAAKRMGIEIKSSSQSAHQADGSSPLKVIGEVHTNFTRDGRELHFEGLVVETLDVDILAGIPFMEKNDISIRPAKRQVILGNNTVYTYGSVQNTSEHHTVRRAHVLRAPAQFTTIWPGDFLEMQLPSDICSTDDTFAIEPRLESHVSSMHAGKDSNVWPPPNLITSVAGRIRIPNLTQEPHSLRRNEHFCQIRSTYVPECISDAVESTENIDKINHPRLTNHSESVKIDPDNLLSQELKVKFRDTVKNFDDVFRPIFQGIQWCRRSISS
ncbi:Hypothetical predicted protein [Mytilus galloprovincialis]|nr:Hypothetical predicted protein [Mytilus galloprovincialis]